MAKGVLDPLEVHLVDFPNIVVNGPEGQPPSRRASQCGTRQCDYRAYFPRSACGRRMCADAAAIIVARLPMQTVLLSLYEDCTRTTRMRKRRSSLFRVWTMNVCDDSK